MNESLGERLKRERAARGWTQAGLAVRAGVSQSLIGNIESGIRGYGESIIDVARALKVDPDYLRGKEPATDRPVDLALRLASARGWDQTAFGAAVGASSATVSNWKKRGMPADQHQVVADALSISVDQLLGRAEMADAAPFREDFKDRLHEAMAKNGVSTQQLANALGVSYQAIRAVLAGVTNSLTAANNAKAAGFMNVDPGWLATGQEAAPPSAPWDAFAAYIAKLEDRVAALEAAAHEK